MSNEALAALAAEASAAVLTGADAGSDPAGATAPDATTPAPEAATPDLDAIRAEAARAERARISRLDGMALPGCEAIISAAKESGAAPEAAAVQIVDHLRASKALDVSAAMATAAASVPDLPVAAHDPLAGAAAAAGATTPAAGPEAWKAEYAASARLQAEFRSEGAYVAWRRAEASGRARVFNTSKEG